MYAPAESADNRPSRKKCCPFVAALLLMLLPGLPAPAWGGDRPGPAATPSYTAVLTKTLKEKQSAVTFHCREKVFLAFTWLGLRGKHRVTALWFNPRGRQQDQIDLEFLAERPKVENWVALTFHDAPGSDNPFLPDIFSAHLNGDWQVKILLDGNFLETLAFRVHCG